MLRLQVAFNPKVKGQRSVQSSATSYAMAVTPSSLQSQNHWLRFQAFPQELAVGDISTRPIKASLYR
jgi:hypothetical protein